MFYVLLLMSSTAENQPPNNSLTDRKEHPNRIIKHHRTVSLPTGCPLFQEPLKIVHERTRSAPLTGDEVDRAFLEKAATHSSCKTVNGIDAFAKKSQWPRRASTGTRLSKLSPAHSKSMYLHRLLTRIAHFTNFFIVTNIFFVVNCSLELYSQFCLCSCFCFIVHVAHVS